MFRSIVLLAVVSASAYAEVSQGPSPERLTRSDWSSIRVEYERHRRAAFPVDGGHLARNYAQRWATRFDGTGFEIMPDSGGWRWGLELRSYGFHGQERGVGHATAIADVEKLSYRWDSTMTEWFVNAPAGLEHGFTLVSRPGNGAGALVLHMAVRGTLAPRVSADGRWVSFANGRGAAALNYAGMKVTDALGRELSARFELEPLGLRLEVDESGARYPITIDPVAQQAYLKPANVATTQTNHWFGYSVAVSGDTAVVGAPQEDSSSRGVNSVPNDLAEKAGAAYVFVRSAGVWSQQAYLKPAAVGTSQVDDRFGWSVAVSGDTVVVGAIREDGPTLGVNSTPSEGATDAGAAYVFVRSGSAWSQQAYLKPAAVGTTQVSDQFGWSVAVSGDTVVVGAYDEASSTTGVNSAPNELASGAGAAYVFVRNAGLWNQQAYLKPAAVGTTQANDHFGASVAVSDDTVVVGAFQEDSSTTGINSTPNELAGAAGAAYVFARSAGAWSQQAYLKPSAVGTSQAGDNFGASVAVSGDTVVVGANSESSSTTGVNSAPNESAGHAGAAYVFVRSAGVWNQQAYLKPTAAGVSQTFNNFGWSVALSGDTAVVGAVGEASSTSGIDSTPNKSASSAGAAYTFTRNAGVWSQQAYLKPAAVGTTQVNDNFGTSVAVSGDTVLVGAYLEDSSTLAVNGAPNESAVDAGAAYVFTLPLPVTITVNTSPAGLMFNSIGAGCSPGSGYTAPRMLGWTSGASCTLSVPTPQAGFTFVQWEDASANPVRGITVPSADHTYTATFAALPPNPGLHLDAVLNGASFALNQAVAPGSLVSLFGAGFTTTAGVPASTPKLPATLGGVSVTFNGAAAPLSYVLPGQINAQVPWGATDPASVIVTVNGVSAAPLNVPIAPVAPGVFAAGTQAIAINLDGTLAAAPGAIPGLSTHPASPGDTILLYATGLGAVSPSIEDGAPSSDALRTAATPVVRIGGVPAQVAFAGLTPQFTGVYQLNVVVPQIAAGVQPVQIGAGGVVSTAQTTMTVQNP